MRTYALLRSFALSAARRVSFHSPAPGARRGTTHSPGMPDGLPGAHCLANPFLSPQARLIDSPAQACRGEPIPLTSPSPVTHYGGAEGTSCNG